MPAPTAQRSPETATVDILPTIQINGVAWSQVIIGNTVYVGGSQPTTVAANCRRAAFTPFDQAR